jgi:ferredoxin-thioredoxin reductase catalytic chain
MLEVSDSDLARRAEALRAKLHAEAEAGGYHLNPDREMLLMLCEGLLTNIERYGYMGCPCRLLDGVREKDIDLICPCDYRDPDLEEFGACFCALYVTEDILRAERKVTSIPERRPSEAERAAPQPATAAGVKVWRCKVCGYLCAREHPPERCPVCKADRDRFEGFSPAGPPVWRCKVCGYLAARDKPPERCPICKVEKDRFETFRL